MLRVLASVAVLAAVALGSDFDLKWPTKFNITADKTPQACFAGTKTSIPFTYGTAAVSTADTETPGFSAANCGNVEGRKTDLFSDRVWAVKRDGGVDTGDCIDLWNGAVQEPEPQEYCRVITTPNFPNNQFPITNKWLYWKVAAGENEPVTIKVTSWSGGGNNFQIGGYGISSNNPAIVSSDPDTHWVRVFTGPVAIRLYDGTSGSGFSLEACTKSVNAETRLEGAFSSLRSNEDGDNRGLNAPYRFLVTRQMSACRYDSNYKENTPTDDTAQPKVALRQDAWRLRHFDFNSNFPTPVIEPGTLLGNFPHTSTYFVWPEKIITSPNWPSNYPDNQDITWRLPEGRWVLEVTDFDLENCCDKLYINGGQRTGVWTTTYTGKPTIRFTSNGGTTESGFRLVATSVAGPAITMSQTGQYPSPNQKLTGGFHANRLWQFPAEGNGVWKPFGGTVNGGNCLARSSRSCKPSDAACNSVDEIESYACPSSAQLLARAGVNNTTPTNEWKTFHGLGKDFFGPNFDGKAGLVHELYSRINVRLARFDGRAVDASNAMVIPGRTFHTGSGQTLSYQLENLQDWSGQISNDFSIRSQLITELSLLQKVQDAFTWDPQTSTLTELVRGFMQTSNVGYHHWVALQFDFTILANWSCTSIGSTADTPSASDVEDASSDDTFGRFRFNCDKTWNQATNTPGVEYNKVVASQKYPAVQRQYLDWSWDVAFKPKDDEIEVKNFNQDPTYVGFLNSLSNAGYSVADSVEGRNGKETLKPTVDKQVQAATDQAYGWHLFGAGMVVMSVFFPIAWCLANAIIGKLAQGIVLTNMQKTPAALSLIHI